MQKKVVVVGGLGVSARRDRDPDRVVWGGMQMYTIPSHCYKDNILTLRKYKKGEKNDRRCAK